MREPRTGAATRREPQSGGRRDVDDTLAEDSPPDNRPVVVLVEDDPASLDGLARWLAGEGFQVLSCATFADARVQLATRRVDALLTDVRLGEFNGLHLVQLARTLHPGARLVVFSGYSDEMLQAEARSVGAIWLLKPLDLRLLREHLADLPPEQDEPESGGETR